jgi:hypothetical protein
MGYPFPFFPQGTLSIVDAINWVARRRDDEWTIWPVLQQVAWREIREGVLKRIFHPYVMDSAGQSHEADRAQFAALGDQGPISDLASRQFASTTLESLDVSGFPRMTMILPITVRSRHVSGLLFFLKSDFDAAWWESMEPKTKTEAIAKWLRRNPQTRGLPAKALKAAMQPDLGIVHARTLTRAKKMAWPS